MKTGKRILTMLLAVVMAVGVIGVNPDIARADTFENYPPSSIVIKLEDAVTGRLLDGGRFEVFFNAGQVPGQFGTLVGTFDTGHSGTIILSGLPAGYYIIRQVQAPTNYQLSIINEQHVFIKADYTSVEEVTFSNYRYGGLLVILTDAKTGAPIRDASFSVSDVNNKAVGNSADGIYFTDAMGQFYLENLPAGDYVVTQLTTADGYAMDPGPHVRTLRLQHTNADQSVFRATFQNSALGSLLIRVYDSSTNTPLNGARFNVKTSGGADLGEFTSSGGGQITLPKLDKGSYIITQIAAPDGFLPAEAQTVYVDYNDTFTADFYNAPKSSLTIVARDQGTKEPIPGTQFRISIDDTLMGTYTTGIDGTLVLSNLTPGRYTIVPHYVPSGYNLDATPQYAQVTDTTQLVREFEFKRTTGLLVNVICEQLQTPIDGAEIRLTRQDGTFVATLTTDASGQVSFENLAPGWYIVTQTRTVDGYIIFEQPQTVEIKDTVPTVITIRNRPVTSIQVDVICEHLQTPIAGAEIRLTRQDGTFVEDLTTDASGRVNFTGLAPGWYTITQTRTIDGYIMFEAPQTIEIKSGVLSVVTIRNRPVTAIAIETIDKTTNLGIAGASYEITRPNGEVVDTVTDQTGLGFILPNLVPGLYNIKQITTPPNYTLEGDSFRSVDIKSGVVTTVKFYHVQQLGLQIEKIDSQTKRPLPGATFVIKTPSGEVMGRHTTDASGSIMINLPDGVYVVTEEVAPQGYMLVSTPQTVTVVPGKITTVVFENTAHQGAILLKLDSVTNQPIQGAVFQIHRANGHSGFGTAGDFVGEFTTNSSGIINLPALVDGTYIATEVKAPVGYNLAEPQVFTIRAGGNPHMPGSPAEQMIIRIYNNPMGTSIIHKKDSVTGRPVQGAVYEIRALDGSHGQNMQQHTLISGGMTSGLTISLGTVETNAAGIAIISHLPMGWYTMTEIRAPYGYEVDPRAYNFQIVGNGVPTIINVEDTPIMGSIVLTKRAANYNRATGHNTGDVLEGAVYAILDKDGTQVDEIETGRDGTARSKALMLGTYSLVELKAPSYFMIDPRPINVTISKQGQIVQATGVNEALSLGMTIKKTSDQRTANWGDTLNYYISGIQNTSNVYLDNFQVTDNLPDPAVAQIQWINTGAWNKMYRFTVSYSTNVNTVWTQLPGQYTSLEAHQIDMNAGNLGLRQGEYVTRFRLDFIDSVEPGFRLIEAMRIQMVAQYNVRNGVQFTNYATASGSYQGNLIKADSHWTIQMYGSPGTLPKTGN